MRTVDITVVIPSVTIPESFGLTSNTEVSASEGWKKASSGSWYYTDANGRCYTGIHTINGKTYYFSMRGQLLS